MKSATHLIARLAGVLAVIATSSTAYAATDPSYVQNSAQGWYGGLSGDLTWLRHSNTGGGGNVALGYSFPAGADALRLEAEVGYHGAKGEDGAARTHYFTYMANAYYDFNSAFASGSASGLRPYIGAGVGDATVRFGEKGYDALTSTFADFSENDNVLAYQVMAGLNYTPQSMPRTDWYLGYRFVGSESSSFLDNAGNRGSDRLHANNIEAGFRYHF